MAGLPHRWVPGDRLANTGRPGRLPNSGHLSRLWAAAKTPTVKAARRAYLAVRIFRRPLERQSASGRRCRRARRYWAAAADRAMRALPLRRRRCAPYRAGGFGATPYAAAELTATPRLRRGHRRRHGAAWRLPADWMLRKATPDRPPTRLRMDITGHSGRHLVTARLQPLRAS